jgi:hypothetical protein
MAEREATVNEAERTTAPTIARAVPNVRSDRPADTRDFFTGLLGCEVTMDLG